MTMQYTGISKKYRITVSLQNQGIHFLAWLIWTRDKIPLSHWELLEIGTRFWNPIFQSNCQLMFILNRDVYTICGVIIAADVKKIT